ncbi:YybH family protein [Fodinibius halophilus]|uniref:Nuclear transport factor 2 family protein n=1 Tax=Fodinibius halophilus TaxID=1736908 RepID=A0A6M1TC48_9BACT|nr:DUF4440 domain-containing protein [Fodinibius halophilus]NGP89943.1 nuclear transport factor 2 family protein [Fodinibius halophilus]
MSILKSYCNFVLLSLLFLFIGISPAFGQKAPKSVDKVYEQFSKAYEQLNLSMVAALYHKEAYYLTPNPEDSIRKGIGNIIDSFRGTFESAQKRGSSLKISFDIVERETSGNMAYDVGYYKFEAFPNEGKPFKSAGKFVTILRKKSDGRWQFVVDAFSDAPVTAFKQ